MAGVSQATVSRVLQGNAKVHPVTRDRVLKAVADTGYSPNAMARAMKTRRTGTIGVVVDRVTNPFYPQLLEALTHELAALDHRMILWNLEGPGELSAVEAIRQGLIDGVVFTTVRADSTAFQEALRRQAPVVLVNRSVEGAPCDQVTSDNAGGTRKVADYFLAAGHRRIGFIGGPAGTSTADERAQGFGDALARNGATLAPELCRTGDFSHVDGHAAMRQLLQRPDPPTAVFCVNDLTAFGAIDGARAIGAAVPDDVWVVGYDDIDMASWEAFDLTTVRQPITEMVQAAVRLLIDRIGGAATQPRHQRFPSELVIRGSTGHTPFVLRTASG